MTEPRVFKVTMKHGVEITGILRSTYYGDGSPALQIWDAEGPESLSINLSAYGMVAPEGHIFVKNYSEHEGLPDELQRLGIATKVNEVPIGYGSGWLMKLADGVAS
jgi:hypothetical protein